MTIQKTCVRCDQQFVASSNRQKYCVPGGCPTDVAVCLFCGETFRPARHSSGQFCSTEHWYASRNPSTIPAPPSPIPPGWKTCTKCRVSKEMSAFPGQRSQPDGKFPWCRSCCHENYVVKRDARREAELSVAAEATNRFGEFGEWVRSNRKRRGMTQDALGRAVGVGGTQVRLWEKGISFPRQSALLTLCSELGEPLPLVATRGNDGRIPYGIDTCAHCGDPFPIYKKGQIYCGHACAAKEQPKGAASSSWKGGRIKAGGGYMKLKMPEHPHADKNGYISEHRYMYEQEHGRFMEPEERVHHLNGVRNDNRTENFELWHIKKKDPAGIRAADYHCAGCSCFDE